MEVDGTKRIFYRRNQQRCEVMLDLNAIFTLETQRRKTPQQTALPHQPALCPDLLSHQKGPVNVAITVPNAQFPWVLDTAQESLNVFAWSSSIRIIDISKQCAGIHKIEKYNFKGCMSAAQFYSHFDFFLLYLEAAQINFTAVENHANIVQKEAFNSLLLLCTTQIAPPVLTQLSVFSVIPLYSTSQC